MPQPSDDEIQKLVLELNRGGVGWVNGRTENFGTDHMVQAPDMTIFGPFGGNVTTNGLEFEARQVRMSAKFQSGTAKYELLKAMASGDMLVLVMAERCEVRFEGRSEPQPWILRTTQVFQRDGGQWLRLHRHADPLIKRRSFEETLGLAAETGAAQQIRIGRVQPRPYPGLDKPGEGVDDLGKDPGGSACRAAESSCWRFRGESGRDPVDRVGRIVHGRL